MNRQKHANYKAESKATCKMRSVGNSLPKGKPIYPDKALC